MIPRDPAWSRVAGQLRRARGPIEIFDRDRPDRALDRPAVLGRIRGNVPSGERLRSPAGWMIRNLRDAGARNGVRRVADTHPDGATGAMPTPTGTLVPPNATSEAY